MGYKEFIYTRKLPNEQNIIKYCMRIEIKGNQCGRWGLRVQRIEIINKIIICICGPPLPIPQILGFFCLFVGHSVYQLDVGSQFPNQGLNPGRRGESTKSWSRNPQGTCCYWFLFIPLWLCNFSLFSSIPVHGVSWWLFHVHLKRICTLGPGWKSL